jgi:hypothetical protein
LKKKTQKSTPQKNNKEKNLLKNGTTKNDLIKYCGASTGWQN